MVWHKEQQTKMRCKKRLFRSSLYFSGTKRQFDLQSDNYEPKLVHLVAWSEQMLQMLHICSGMQHNTKRLAEIIWVHRIRYIEWSNFLINGVNTIILTIRLTMLHRMGRESLEEWNSEQMEPILSWIAITSSQLAIHYSICRASVKRTAQRYLLCKLSTWK